MKDQALWDRVHDYRVATGFEEELRRATQWRPERVSRTVEEYYRFLYLVCVSGEVLIPPYDLARVWRLHLTYTRDYWERLCDGALHMKLHYDHGPGPEAAGTPLEPYLRMRELYQWEFGVPPQKIWPDEGNLRKAQLAPKVGSAAFVLSIGSLVLVSATQNYWFFILLALSVCLIWFFGTYTSAPRRRSEFTFIVGRRSGSDSDSGDGDGGGD